MPLPLPREPTPGPSPLSLLQSAFRDLHRDRLYGFALLLTLGDRRVAAEAVARALDAGARDVTEHRYPERAAVWLRARLVGSVRWRRLAVTPASYVALEPLGISRSALSGLAALSMRERAAIVALDVERFDPGDAASILDLRPAALLALGHRARQRYLAAVPTTGLAEDGTDGPLRRRVRSVAERALT